MGIASVFGGSNSPLEWWKQKADARRQSAADSLATAAGNAAVSDEVNLSAAAEAAANAAADSSSPASPGSAGLLASLVGGSSLDRGVSIDDMNQEHTNLQASVSAKLHQLFRDNGIDDTQPIRLQTASDGQVIVVGEHPQKAEIEKLFQNDPQLRNDFVHLQSLTETIGAAHEAMAFQAAYRNDPRAAVAQYSYLFDSQVKSAAYLTIKGEQALSVFEHGAHSEVVGPQEEK